MAFKPLQIKFMEKTVLIKLAQIFLFLLGATLLINAIIASILSNIHEGVLCCYIFAFMFLFYGIFLKHINYAFPKILIIAFWFCLLTLIIYVSFLFIYGTRSNSDFKEDVVIVLGAGLNGKEPGNDLKGRLEKTVEYIEKNPNAYVIVSGGQGPDEEICEALAMENYLISRGISAEKIIKEDNSFSTIDNFNNSKIIINKLANKDKVVFITTNYHIFRARTIALNCGYSENISYIGGSVPIYLAIPCCLRECMAVIKNFIIK